MIKEKKRTQFKLFGTGVNIVREQNFKGLDLINYSLNRLIGTQRQVLSSAPSSLSLSLVIIIIPPLPDLHFPIITNPAILKQLISSQSWCFFKSTLPGLKYDVGFVSDLYDFVYQFQPQRFSPLISVDSRVRLSFFVLGSVSGPFKSLATQRCESELKPCTQFQA